MAFMPHNREIDSNYDGGGISCIICSEGLFEGLPNISLAPL
jgi:hypothetical protein